MINKTKKIILLISILMLTLSIGITASADEIYPKGSNNYPFYNVSSIIYSNDDEAFTKYNIERTVVNDYINATGDVSWIVLGDEYLSLEMEYNYIEYNEYFNLNTTYKLIQYSLPTNITLSYKYFVLKDYFLEEDIYSSLENTIVSLDSGSYFNIDSVEITCYVLEYKFINDEWQIVPVLYEFEVDTYVKQDTQQESINFALIFDELQNYNSRDEYAIRDMYIKFNLSYNDTSSTNPYIITDMGYVNYENTSITDILTSLNKQVLLVPIEHDYTSWLVKAVGGFLDTEIVPGFSIGGIFGVVLMIALLSYILKMFLGG